MLRNKTLISRIAPWMLTMPLLIPLTACNKDLDKAEKTAKFSDKETTREKNRSLAKEFTEAEIIKIESLKAKKDSLEKEGFEIPDDLLAHALETEQTIYYERVLDFAKERLGSEPEKLQVFFDNITNGSTGWDSSSPSFYGKLKQLKLDEIKRSFKSNDVGLLIDLHALSYPDSAIKPAKISKDQLEKILIQYEIGDEKLEFNIKRIAQRLSRYSFHLKSELLDIVIANLDNSVLVPVLSKANSNDLNNLEAEQFENLLVWCEKNESFSTTDSDKFKARIVRYSLRNIGTEIPANTEKQVIDSVYKAWSLKRINPQQSQSILNRINTIPASQSFLIFLNEGLLSKPEQVEKILNASDEKSVHAELVNAALANEKQNEKRSIFGDLYFNSISDHGAVKPRTAELCQSALEAGLEPEKISQFMLDRRAENYILFHSSNYYQVQLIFARKAMGYSPKAKIVSKQRTKADPKTPTKLVRDFQKSIAEAQTDKN